ncbi:hypothetical protein KAH27_04950 [bacterium]|nr:hypothetical protein [bacterium]
MNSNIKTQAVTLFDLKDIVSLSSNTVNNYWDHFHVVSALQGIVNRDAPLIYIKYVINECTNKNVDEYWFAKLTDTNAWLDNINTESVTDIVELVTKFKNHLNGAVVYDPNVPATSNVASTIAGVEDLLPVRYDTSPNSLYTRLIIEGPQLSVIKSLINADGSSLFTGHDIIPDTNIPSSGSAKCDAYLWMKHFYIDTGLCNTEWAAYYVDYFWKDSWQESVPNHHCLTNHDFFISNKAFFFDLHVWDDEAPNDDLSQPPGTDLNILKALLLSAYNQRSTTKMLHIGGFVPWAYKYTTESGCTHDPVSSEWEYGKIISAYNGFMDADAIGFGAMANASFYKHYPLEKEYPQKWISENELEERGLISNIEHQTSNIEHQTTNHQLPTTNSERQFLIFYVGDYDCAAWLYQRSMDIWDDPNRGKIPMMWAISPVIAARAPMVMDYIRKTATENDYFVAADNGAGYCEPGMLQEPRDISGLPSGLDAWEKHCSEYYKKWGLDVTGFIIPGNGPLLNKDGLDTYEKFSPNGIVPLIGDGAKLHNNMPVIYAARDIQFDDPIEAARVTVENIHSRTEQGTVPFHWYRNILKTPTWYLQVYQEIQRLDPDIELLDAPSFFELLRIYLKSI